MKKDKTIKRIFEILPGLLSWIVILSPIWGGIFFPYLLAYFILVFNAFWLYKSVSTVIFFIIGHFRVREGENTDWIAKLKRLKNPDKSIDQLHEQINLIKKDKYQNSSIKNLKRVPTFLKKIIFQIQKRKAINFLKHEIKLLKKIDTNEILDSEKLHHIIIIPYWKEDYNVLKKTIDKLVDQTFPTKQISIVLGAEARHPPAFELGEQLKKEYQDKFEYIWVNNHILTPKEIIGKASNMSSCGKRALKEINKLNWDKNYVTITSCDCDTKFDPNYFAYFSYLFVTDKDRYYHYFAAPMVFYANIWKIPFYSRVANTLFTVNNIATIVRPDKFIQISSYSFSWKLLEDIDFWSVDVIPEDFHMFFKALFIHRDKVMTVPINLKNLSDAAESIGHTGTIKNQYEQVKRWAWGVSDDGWMIINLFKSKKKTLYMFYRVFHTVFDHFTWSIISFILLFGANIPPLINNEFNNTILGQRLPKVSSAILTISSLSFVIILIFDFFVKPSREGKISIMRLALEQLQWFTFPVVSFVFGAIPGLDAQTRLMLGKYMEYRLTEKH